MFATEGRTCVRYKKTDQMGVVHHSNYYICFEAKRSGFLKAPCLILQIAGAEGPDAPGIRCVYQVSWKIEKP
ncbi:MAG TPA: hypothetical protein PK830_09505 [Candidatus Atribacteria bacterium]|nr:hypothetical protein [Candidatus Atribacteria bacterium]HPT79322.1 hypothetical protein [Candidatus Atribacteria bacterium]